MKQLSIPHYYECTTSFLDETDYLDLLQSGFRPGYEQKWHRSHFLWPMISDESGMGSSLFILALLDLSATFDTIDDGIFLEWLWGLQVGGHCVVLVHFLPLGCSQLIGSKRSSLTPCFAGSNRAQHFLHFCLTYTSSHWMRLSTNMGWRSICWWYPSVYCSPWWVKPYCDLSLTVPGDYNGLDGEQWTETLARVWGSSIHGKLPSLIFDGVSLSQTAPVHDLEGSPELMIPAWRTSGSHGQ